MTNQIRTLCRTGVLASMLGCWLAGPVVAQTTPPAGEGDPPRKTGETGAAKSSRDSGDLLAGPRVEELIPRAASGDLMRANDRGRAAAPAQRWFRILKGLDLTREQEAVITQITDAYRQDARDYQQEYGDELNELRRQFRAAREAGNDAPREIRRKMGEITANAPKVRMYQERIWNELTDDQRTRMRDEIDKLRRQANERRGQRDRDMRDTMRDEPRRSDRREGGPGDGARAVDGNGERSVELERATLRRLRFLLNRQTRGNRELPRATDRRPDRRTDRPPRRRSDRETDRPRETDKDADGA